MTPVERGAFADTRVNVSETRTFTAPMAPGEYPFYCKFHAGPKASPTEAMAGVLVVTPAAATSLPETTAKPTPGLGLLLALAAIALVAGRRERRR